MIRRTNIILAAEAIICVCIAVVTFYFADANNAFVIFCLPFEGTGNLLRLMSVSSGIGNLTAWVLYSGLSFTPTGYVIIRAIKRKNTPSWLLLVIMSGYLFFALYYFINPGMMKSLTLIPVHSAEFIWEIKGLFALGFYSLLIGYFALRYFAARGKELSFADAGIKDASASGGRDNRTMESISKNRMIDKLNTVLYISAIIVIALVFYFKLHGLFFTLDAFSAEASAAGDRLFAVMRFTADVLPTAFMCFIIIRAMALMQALKTDYYGAGSVERADALAGIARTTIYVSVVCNISINLLQLMFMNQISDTNINLSFPVIELIVAIGAAVLSGYLKQGIELYNDNRMII